MKRTSPQKAHLEELLESIEQEDYPKLSRVHPLRLDVCPDLVCYVKREDELGALVSGSKIRKFRTLIPALKKRGCRRAALIGSRSSNALLGLSSLLIENGIAPTLFVKASPEVDVKGNALFLQLFVQPEQIHPIEAALWPEVELIAKRWQEEHAQEHACVIGEGGPIEECLGGLLTLALDILRNEEELGMHFKDIFIDSGSGVTAAALIVAFGYLQKPCHIHVMLAASDKDAFWRVVDTTKASLEARVGHRVASLPQSTLYSPTTAKSFGSTNSQIFQTIKGCARKDGLLLDPIYSSKLYLLLEAQAQKGLLQGPILFIHSGGLFSLAGFHEQVSSSFL